MLLSSQSNPPIWKPFLTACREDILYQSRVHRLRSFEREGTEVWLKREDESGFGTSGSKKRKIASLLPWLKQQDIQRLGIIGGARSNHVVSLLQWAREESLEVRCLLKASQTPAEGGNAMLLRLLCEEREIRWLSAEEWPVAEEIAEKEFGGEDAYIVQEGGYCAAAVAGAATLLMDIERNEQALGGAFDQIVIDAGTGLSAAVLCCINAWRERKTEIHVVLTAGTIQTFGEAVAQCRNWLDAYQPMPETISGYHCHRPATAASFGSVNATIREAVKRYARTEGLLCDPIYTAKLLYTAEKLIDRGVLRSRESLQPPHAPPLKGGEMSKAKGRDEEKNFLRSRTLIVHNGGGTGLMGFSF